MVPRPQFPFFFVCSVLNTEIVAVFELLRLGVLRYNFWEWVLTYFEVEEGVWEEYSFAVERDQFARAGLGFPSACK